jgi:hypothetical protein
MYNCDAQKDAVIDDQHSHECCQLVNRCCSCSHHFCRACKAEPH